MHPIDSLGEIITARDAGVSALALGVPALIWVVKHFITRGGDRTKRTYGFEDIAVTTLKQTIADLRTELASVKSECAELKKEVRDLYRKRRE